MTRQIWLVDDEPEIRALMRDYLEHAGFQCTEFANGDDMLAALTTEHSAPSLILLDVMMPGHDGFEVCRQLRVHSTVPVLFLSAKSEEFDRILGLKLGADDYLVKPVSPREVVARIESMLRRMEWQSTPEITDANLEVNLDAMQVRWKAQPVPFTLVEFKIFNTLSQRPQRVFSRQELMDAVYDDHRVVSDRTVDSHVKNVRSKLASVAPRIEFIESVYGAGYRFIYNSTISP